MNEPHSLLPPPDFDAQLAAALMIQSNALVPMKLVVKLCGLSRQEIDRRIQSGIFPKAVKLSAQENAMRKAFYLDDIQQWLRDPQHYTGEEMAHE